MLNIYVNNMLGRVYVFNISLQLSNMQLSAYLLYCSIGNTEQKGNYDLWLEKNRVLQNKLGFRTHIQANSTPTFSWLTREKDLEVHMHSILSISTSD